MNRGPGDLVENYGVADRDRMKSAGSQHWVFY